MHGPLVSVIVPVYNVEHYIARCLSSIVKQSYTNLQIILINDGSRDRSLEICRSYASADNRMVIIDKENGGASSARNAGLDVASGEYVTFVDSDDFIHQDYVFAMLQACTLYGCEVAQCAFLVGNESRFVQNHVGKSVKIYDRLDVFRGRKLKIIVWAKLYKMELFSELRFPVGRIHEDEYVTYRAVYAANRIAILDAALYYYYMSENSVMRGNDTTLRLDFLDAYKERIAFFADRNEDELTVLSRKELAIRAMLYYVRARSKSDKLANRLLEVCREQSRYVITDRRVALIERLLITIFLLAPSLCARIMK